MFRTCEVPGTVLFPCLIAAVLVLFLGLEKLIWQTASSYPGILAQIRYVDDLRLLTPQAMRDICNLPHTNPELERKRNGLFLRCGTPVIEGIYLIKQYKNL